MTMNREDVEAKIKDVEDIGTRFRNISTRTLVIILMMFFVPLAAVAIFTPMFRFGSADIAGYAAAARNAVTGEPKLNAITQLAAAQLKVGDYDGAVKNYTVLISSRRDDVVSYIGRGMAYAQGADWDHAIADYGVAIRLDGQAADTFFLRGNAHLAKLNIANAESDYRMAIKLDPDEPEYRLAMGRLKYTTGDADTSEVEQAIRMMEKQRVPFSERAVAQILNGNLYRVGRRLDYALAAYNIVLVYLDPASPEAHYGRATVLIDLGRTKEALPDLDYLVDTYPADPNPPTMRGIVHGLLGDKEAAVADFDKALAADPISSQRYLLRSWALFRAGHLAGAMKDANRAVFLDGKLGAAYATRARIEMAAGNKAAATADFQTALSLVPNMSNAKDGLKEVAGLRPDADAVPATDRDRRHVDLSDALVRKYIATAKSFSDDGGQCFVDIYDSSQKGGGLDTGGRTTRSQWDARAKKNGFKDIADYLSVCNSIKKITDGWDRSSNRFVPARDQAEMRIARLRVDRRTSDDSRWGAISYELVSARAAAAIRQQDIDLVLGYVDRLPGNDGYQFGFHP
jgi:tetratricopeptide (TPR) repeat protein